LVAGASASLKVTTMGAATSTWIAPKAGDTDATCGGERSAVRKWLVNSCVGPRP
jgi:hypothetical protein